MCILIKNSIRSLKDALYIPQTKETTQITFYLNKKYVIRNYNVELC